MRAGFDTTTIEIDQWSKLYRLFDMKFPERSSHGWISVYRSGVVVTSHNP